MNEVLKYKRRPPVVGTRPAPIEAQHGKKVLATKAKCPCDKCEKWRVDDRAKRAAVRREQYVPKPRKPWSHGTSSGWDKHKCTCDVCVTHKREYLKIKHQRAAKRKKEQRAAAASGH